MVAAGDPAALAVKARGSSTPFVFVVGQDPVHSGLVPSMNRPGKATGVNFFTGDLSGKRLDLLCGMAPSANLIGLLLNPRSGAAEQHLQAAGGAAQSLGRELIVQAATNSDEIEAAFAALAKDGVNAIVVQNDPFFDSRRGQIIALSSRHGLPGIFHIREFPADGGLMSYGIGNNRHLDIRHA
jgi:putative ABC transport system substrate-binding protein